MTILSLITGYIIDLLIGDPKNIPHPICFIGNLISLCEKILRKIFHNNPKSLRIAGTLLTIVVLAISTLIPLAILLIANKIHPIAQYIIESIMIWQILATKSLKTQSMYVYHSLKAQDIEKSRFNLSMIVGRDTANLNEKAIIKATVETIAENTSDGVIAPMIYCALGGATLGFAYKAINTMDSMIGYKNEKYRDFGRTAAKLDDFVNYLPSRICAWIMIFSSFLLRMNTKNAVKIWKRDKRKHKSPNSAQTESVCAGALEIQLAGDAVYGGTVHKKDFIGDKIREIEITDIKKANTLMLVTSLVSIGVITILKFVFLHYVLGGFNVT